MINNFKSRGNTYELYLDNQIAVGTLNSKDMNGFIAEMDEGIPIEERLIDNIPKAIGYMNKGVRRNQNGSNVVFTGKQYIFSSNLGDGEIGHVVSIAKTMIELRGDHSILSLNDARRVYRNYKDNYIRLRISSENHGSGEMHYSMRLYHNKNKAISPEEYASVEAFVQKFGMYFSKFPFSYYLYSYTQHEGSGCSQVVSDLESYLEYLKMHVKDDAKPYVHPKGEQIIGTPNRYRKSYIKMFIKKIIEKAKGEVA